MEHYTIPFGRNEYCGPAALAYLLRTDPDTAARKLRDASGKRAICGTPRTAMLLVLLSEQKAVTQLNRAFPVNVRLGKLNLPAEHEYLLVVNTDRGTHYIVVHCGTPGYVL